MNFDLHAGLIVSLVVTLVLVLVVVFRRSSQKTVKGMDLDLVKLSPVIPLVFAISFASAAEEERRVEHLVATAKAELDRLTLETTSLPPPPKMIQEAEIVALLQGQKMDETCDRNGVVSESGDIGCATRGEFRVWFQEADMKLAQVQTDGSVLELMRVKPDFIYSADPVDIKETARVDWEKLNLALDTHRYDNVVPLSDTQIKQLHDLLELEGNN